MAKAATEIRSLARSHTESAIKTLAKVMTSPKAPAAARVAASCALLDRGWGKPTIMVAGDPDGPPVKTEEVSRDPERLTDLARRIAFILNGAAHERETRHG